MTDEDVLAPLRELPIPAIAPELSATIRETAHRRLASNREGGGAQRSARSVLAMAAVVVLCASHLGWTMTFLTKLHAPRAQATAAQRR